MNKRQTYEQANKVFDKAVKLEQDFGEFFTGLCSASLLSDKTSLSWVQAPLKSCRSSVKPVSRSDVCVVVWMPECVCVCSDRTGRLARGDLQQNQAHHRGAVRPLHLDPFLRKALSSLPLPLHRCRAPLRLPETPPKPK